MGFAIEDLLSGEKYGTRPRSSNEVRFLPDPEPREQWATIISVDDHVVEPPEIFEGRFPKKFADQAPRVIDTDNGGQAWLWNGQVLPNVGFNAVAGRPRADYSFEPTRFDHMRPGAYVIKERLKEMDRNGVWASVCFPSFLPGFVGQRLTMWPEDEELAWAAMRAYNDWHLESWAGEDPMRIIPNQIAWLRDPVKAADEIRRNAERGFKSVSFSEAPHKLGLPTIHSGYWEPFFAACEETETVINLHVGSAGETPTTGDDAPMGVVGALFAASAFTYTVDWLYSEVAIRYPNIKICMSEGGIGWVASIIDRVDHLNERGVDAGDDKTDLERPSSALLRRNFWFCALDDPSGFLTADFIGIDNILVESDYPHSDSTWPDTQPLLKQHLSVLSVEDQRKVCFENAAKLYRHPVPPNPLPALNGDSGAASPLAMQSSSPA
jgi:predicted TIM-barrel fold metal-dependent hydrolase